MPSQDSVDAGVAEKQLAQEQSPQGQMFQGQQQPGYAMPPVQSPGAQVNRGWEMAKRVFHGLIILFSIVGIAVSGALLGLSPSNFYEYYGDTDQISFILGATALPIFAIALVWSVAELVVQVAKKWQSGIHPGAHVGIFLILWLASVVVAALFGTLVGYYSDDSEHYCNRGDGSYYYYGTGDSSDSPNCSGDGDHDKRRILSIVTLAFCALLAVLTFTMFIGACCDTHTHNRSRAVALALASGPVIPAGWRLVPDNAIVSYPAQAHVPQPNAQASQASSAATNQHQVSEYYTPGTAQ